MNLLRFILFIIFIQPIFLQAQFTDNFSDGDFTNNPTWTGLGQYFIINTDNQLQLNSISGQDSTYLVTASSSMNDTQWEFWLRLAFTTSNNNHVKVYLSSDNSDLKAALNGYYIRIGNNAPQPKTANLFRQDGLTHTQILTGVNDVGSASNNIVRIKVIRSSTGNWELFCDPLGGFGYLPQGNVTDNTYPTSNFFGVLCKYTATNITRFYFDDFYVGPIIIDNTPPSISSVQVVSNNQLNVFFTEAVESVSASNPTNYFVNNGIGGPNSAIRNAGNAALVNLTFTNTFTIDQINNLTVSNIADFSGNIMGSENIDFVYTEQKYGDVLINEIMADPDPVVGLPNHEYIELYNKTAFPIDITNWTIQHGSTNRIIPNGVIPADSFIVLCNSAAFAELQAFGNVISVPSLSASALTNGGTTLTLFNENNEIIHAVNYSDTWYGDASKINGGWSLELIDPNFPCLQKDNWSASTHPSGGTPGRKNSIYASKPDITAPSILSICRNNNTLEINFSETLDASSASSENFYSVDNGIGNPNSVTYNFPFNNVFTLTFDSSFNENTSYNLTINSDLSDCAGNKIGANNSINISTFGAEEFDVVINEIMANESPSVGLPTFEYIEIFNRKNYPISLQGWQLSVGTAVRNFPCTTIDANGYLILTNANNVANFNSFGKVAGVVSFPSLTNSGGTISIIDNNGKIISSVSYEDTWYKNSAKINGGWSLEQIDPNNPCEGFDNWIASVSSIGGTPGAINSVNANNPDNKSPRLLRVGINSPNSITLHFDENLSANNLSDVSLYEINGGIGQPSVAFANPPSNSSVTLFLNNPLVENTIYEVTVSADIKDCVGYTVSGEFTKAKFAIPKEILSKDIIINEILFNQRDGGATFVELYNRSNKVLDLKGLRVSRIDTLANQLLQVNIIQENSYLMFPGDFVVVTVNPRAVQNQYDRPHRDNFIRMGGMPTFNNSGGTCVITKANFEEIDKFFYLESMHLPLLKSYKGVSLERLSYERDTQRRDNWHSASKSVNYATPGYKNSQIAPSEEGDSPVTIEPKVFSPDQDGYQDIVNINYQFDEVGLVGSISIYDAAGRLVRQLIKSELLATEGTYTWDGITEQREKARVGIYVIYFEVFDTKGNVQKYKRSVVLASRFN
jgi:hypothetical protein